MAATRKHARQTVLTTTLHPIAIPDPVVSKAIEGMRGEVQHYLQMLAERMDSLSGLRGEPEMFAPLRLRGHRIRNVGEPQEDDDVQIRSGGLSKTRDGRSFDARGLSIINLNAGSGRGFAVPFEQFEARVQELLNNPTFPGTVTIATLIITAVFNHTGTTFGVFSASPATQQAAITDLTDNTGVTADSVIENVPASTGDAGGAATVSAAAAVATVASVNTALTAIENNIADLAAKVDALSAALRTFGFIAP